MDKKAQILDILESLPNFEGKCVSLTTMEDRISHDLLNPYFEVQGGRLFIIGVVPMGATRSNWVAGCQSAIAWDRVTDYFVFENLYDYTKAIKKSEEYEDEYPGMH
jgi:hypothetical protein